MSTSTIRQGRGPYFCDLPYELQDDPDATPAHIAVYLSLRRYADFGGIRGARASHSTLAAKAHVGVDTLQRSLSWLRDRGWVEWASGQAAGKPNDYTVHRSLEGGTAPDGQGVPQELGRGVPHQTGTTESQLPRANTNLPATSAGDTHPGNNNGVSKETWLTPYGVIWQDRYGTESEPPYPLLAKTLRRPHERLGSGTVGPRLARYLREVEAPYVNLPKFVATLGEWAPEKEKLSPYGITDEQWANGHH